MKTYFILICLLIVFFLPLNSIEERSNTRIGDIIGNINSGISDLTRKEEILFNKLNILTTSYEDLNEELKLYEKNSNAYKTLLPRLRGVHQELLGIHREILEGRDRQLQKMTPWVNELISEVENDDAKYKRETSNGFNIQEDNDIANANAADLILNYELYDLSFSDQKAISDLLDLLRIGADYSDSDSDFLDSNIIDLSVLQKTLLDAKLIVKNQLENNLKETGILKRMIYVEYLSYFQTSITDVFEKLTGFKDNFNKRIKDLQETTFVKNNSNSNIDLNDDELCNELRTRGFNHLTGRK